MAALTGVGGGARPVAARKAELLSRWIGKVKVRSSSHPADQCGSWQMVCRILPPAAMPSWVFLLSGSWPGPEAPPRRRWRRWRVENWGFVS